MNRGVVVAYDPAKKYGKIEPGSGGRRISFDLQNQCGVLIFEGKPILMGCQQKQPNVGDVVVFNVMPGKIFWVRQWTLASEYDKVDAQC